MACVQPFRGLRYNPEKFKDLSPLITPPFDVISPQEQLGYYRRSPYNIIRLEFGEERLDDSPGNNRYTRAALTMDGWIRDGVLIRDEVPSFYLVEHRHLHHGSIKSTLGLIARIRLEEWNGGHIRPHELTTEGPKSDRLRLLESLRANISPIMMAFRPDGGSPLFRNMARGVPDIYAVDGGGVRYSVWVVSDEAAIASVSALFADKNLYILDGHHRYQTALGYHSSRGDGASDYVMVVLFDSEDPDLTILPTHRLVRGVDVAGLEERLRLYFDIEESPLPNPLDAILEGEGSALCLYGLGEGRLLLLTAKRAALGELDVGLLHWEVIEGIMGLDGEEGERLGYTHDAAEAISRVDGGEYQLAFLITLPPIGSVLRVADAGVRMPLKSTYFYPKTPAGLVINPIWD